MPYKTNFHSVILLSGDFLFAKSNLFDVDMTAPSYQQSIIDLSLENGNLIAIFNDLKTALLTRLKGDRGQKDTRRSLQYYFVAQDIHANVPTLHILIIKNWRKYFSTAIFYFASNAFCRFRAKPVKI